MSHKELVIEVVDNVYYRHIFEMITPTACLSIKMDIENDLKNANLPVFKVKTKVSDNGRNIIVSIFYGCGRIYKRTL